MMQTINNNGNQQEYYNNQQQKQKVQWILEDFELGPILGKGKFSQVHLAREKKSGFILALKIMDKEFLQSNGLEEQIKREILLQKCVKHDNILQLYGFFHDEKKIYLILEYAEQGDLYSLVHTYQGKKLNENLTKHFIKQVINALQFLHQHNIIHRDLKPENLLISNGDIKLADFGLAAQQNFSQDFQSSIQSIQQYETEKRKTFCGTLDYISPEMFLKKGHDNKIDIWSIGVLIYELTAGSPPFEGNSYNETMQKVIQCQNLKYPITFSAELVDLLKKILILKPEDRLSFKDILNHRWFQQNQNQIR